MTTRRAALPLLLAAFALSATASVAAPVAGYQYAVGARSGPFVVSPLSLGTLAKDGYEIRGNLGPALILQKGASIFSCVIPPDPEHLSYRTYFICSELKEEARAPALPEPSVPRLKPAEPHR